MAGPLNRTGNQMGEQTDEERIVQERLGSLDPTFVHIIDVGDFLKGVKRDAGWKNDTDQGQGNIVSAQLIQPGQKRAREEIEVLEHPKNREIQDEREDKPPFSVCVRRRRSDFLGDQKVDRRAADHEAKEAPIPPAVKKIASAEKENVLGATIKPPVHQHYRYEE